MKTNPSIGERNVAETLSGGFAQDGIHISATSIIDSFDYKT
jgi:hypothetical protein